MIENKLDHWNTFANEVHNHIVDYVLPQYGDLPDKTIANFTPEKIQAKLEAYVSRIGRSSRGKEDAIKDCFKIAHFAAYLYYSTVYGNAMGPGYVNQVPTKDFIQTGPSPLGFEAESHSKEVTIVFDNATVSIRYNK